MREFVIKALRNYGYRFLEKQSGCYIFGKPIGYGIFRVGVSEHVNAVSVILIVKGNEKDGRRPNLVWDGASHGFMEEDDEQKMYEAVVQAIADCEADIFSKTAVAWSQNRDVRYDFEENDVLDE